MDEQQCEAEKFTVKERTIVAARLTEGKVITASCRMVVSQELIDIHRTHQTDIK